MPTDLVTNVLAFDGVVCTVEVVDDGMVVVPPDNGVARLDEVVTDAVVRADVRFLEVVFEL